MKPDVWMPWYIADYLADTQHLTTEQHGAYLIMLATAWMRGGILPHDDTQLAAITRLGAARWKKQKKMLMEFFEVTPEGLRQKRLSKEFATANGAYAAKRANSAKGGLATQKRWRNGGRTKADTKADTKAEAEPEVRPNEGLEQGREVGRNRAVTRLQPQETRDNHKGQRTKNKEQKTKDKTKTLGGRIPPNPPLCADLASEDRSPPESRAKPKTKTGKPPRSRRENPVRQKAKTTPATSETWNAYSQAYEQRHGSVPVRNARINGQLANFVERIGAVEAPAVAGFFVSHNARFYVEKMHPVNLLLADAEKLRTEWATGQKMTETKARETDRRAKHGDDWQELIDESRTAKERVHAR